jgi:hypothetical protein
MTSTSSGAPTRRITTTRIARHTCVGHRSECAEPLQARSASPKVAPEDDAFEQLVEKCSTHRDRFGDWCSSRCRAKPELVLDTAGQHLITNYGGVELAPVAGWRVVRLPDPREPARLIEWAIVCVDVQRFAVAESDSNVLARWSMWGNIPRLAGQTDMGSSSTQRAPL